MADQWSVGPEDQPFGQEHAQTTLRRAGGSERLLERSQTSIERIDLCFQFLDAVLVNGDE